MKLIKLTYVPEVGEHVFTESKREYIVVKVNEYYPISLRSVETGQVYNGIYRNLYVKNDAVTQEGFEKP